MLLGSGGESSLTVRERHALVRVRVGERAPIFDCLSSVIEFS